MRGQYKEWIGYDRQHPYSLSPEADWTPYGHVRPVSEMSWGDVASVGFLIALGGLVIFGAKRAGDYAKLRHQKKLQSEGTLPAARALNGDRR